MNKKLTKQELEDAAWFIARNVHLHQKYGKEPYINHVKRVYESVSSISKDNNETVKIVAILHDSVEDSNVSIEEVEKIFGKIIAQAVQAISRGDGEKYNEYIKRVSKNKFAKMVKICDLIENLKHSYLSSEHESLQKRYEKALFLLATDEME